MKEYRYYVYILQCASRRALYIGVTSNIENRVYQHKQHVIRGFTHDYNVTRLVYLETYSQIQSAIAREKQLKGWRREKKNKLIEFVNPDYKDLSADWGAPIDTYHPKLSS